MTTKVPVRGDKVIDKTRVIKQHGEIISGVFDGITPEGEDICSEAWVQFSPADQQWYSAATLVPHWDPEENAYILDQEEEKKDGEG